MCHSMTLSPLCFKCGLCFIFCESKHCMSCVTGREASTGGRVGCVVYECIEVISIGLMEPLDHPPPVPPKASCWSRGLFVFAFCNEMPSGSIGCAEPALLFLWYASWIWQHNSCIFSFHWTEAGYPSKYSDAQQPPIGPALPSTPPLLPGVNPY